MLPLRDPLNQIKAAHDDFWKFSSSDPNYKMIKILKIWHDSNKSNNINIIFHVWYKISPALDGTNYKLGTLFYNKENKNFNLTYITRGNRLLYYFYDASATDFMIGACENVQRDDFNNFGFTM